MKKRILAFILSVSVLVTALISCGIRFNYNRKDLQVMSYVLDRIKNNYYYDLTEEELIDAMNMGLMQLLDPYSYIRNPQQYADYVSMMNGNNMGFGITVREHEGRVMIVDLAGGSDAEISGLKIGDIITEVKDADSGEVAEADSIDELFDFLRAFGKDKEAVFYVERNGAPQPGITVKKTEYVLKGCVYHDNTSDMYEGLDGGTAVFKLATFTGNAGQLFAQSMQKYKNEGKTKLILDMRNNGGGSITVLTQIAEYLISDGNNKKLDILTYKDKSKKSYAFKTSNIYYNNYTFEKIAVLIDEGSASATEALVGAMLDYGTVTYDDIFGADSYGKGVMQDTYICQIDSSTKYSVTLTVAEIFWPKSGISINGKGIKVNAGNKSEDMFEQYRKALDYISA